MEERRGCSWKAFLIIMALVFGCPAVTTLALDAVCHNVLSQRLPIYPNARITFEQYSFLRRYGMGETIIILDSDDEVEEVRDWYGEVNGRIAQQMREENAMNRFYGFTSAVASVTRAEDGTGSQIVLSGACAAG